jgi:hypothetical protein
MAQPDPAESLVLWLLTPREHYGAASDTFDGVVVAAATEEEARATHPHGHVLEVRGDVERDCWLTLKPIYEQGWGNDWKRADPPPRSWADRPSQITVTRLGDADPSVKPGVVLASFQAG